MRTRAVTRQKSIRKLVMWKSYNKRCISLFYKLLWLFNDTFLFTGTVNYFWDEYNLWINQSFESNLFNELIVLVHETSLKDSFTNGTSLLLWWTLMNSQYKDFQSISFKHLRICCMASEDLKCSTQDIWNAFIILLWFILGLVSLIPRWF